MGRKHAGNVQVNGLGLRLPQDVYSEHWLALNNTVQAAYIFYRKLCEDYPEAGLRVYMNGDGSDVYEDAFRKVAVSSDGIFHPTLVLLGVRLGIDRVTPVYWEALKAIIQMKQSVGIAGYQLPT